MPLHRLLAAFASLALACAPPPPSALVGNATEAQLGALLREHYSAIRRQDRVAYDATVDRTRGTFAACLLLQFEAAARSDPPSAPLTVRRLEPYGDRYARAFVEDARGHARYYFRKDEGRWLITEPRHDELGEERRKTVDGMEVRYWAIDQDIVDAITTSALEARASALYHAVGPTRTPFAVRVYPTREVGSHAPCFAIGAAYVRTEVPEVRLYRIWLEADLGVVAGVTRRTLRHEALHWLQDQMVPGVLEQADWWLREGWPEYLVAAGRFGVIEREACGRGTVPTYTQLGPAYGLGDAAADKESRYYAFASSMVAYLYERHGADAYWGLLREFGSSRREDLIYPKVLRQTPEEFHVAWADWLRARHCSR